MRSDAGHATNMSHESSHNVSPFNHDDEGGDHDSGSTSPSDHGQSVSDPSGSTPTHHSPDDHVRVLVEVPHVSIERVDHPPSPLPHSLPIEVVDHPSSYTIDHISPTTIVVSSTTD